MARARRANLPFLPQCHSVLSMRRCSTSARRRRGWATGRHTRQTPWHGRGWRVDTLQAQSPEAASPWDTRFSRC